MYMNMPGGSFVLAKMKWLLYYDVNLFPAIS